MRYVPKIPSTSLINSIPYSKLIPYFSYVDLINQVLQVNFAMHFDSANLITFMEIL